MALASRASMTRTPTATLIESVAPNSAKFDARVAGAHWIVIARSLILLARQRPVSLFRAILMHYGESLRKNRCGEGKILSPRENPFLKLLVKQIRYVFALVRKI